MPLWDKWRMTFNDSSPIYRQIVLQFNQAFARGDISPGERIPSIREMAALLKVNTNTMQRVYQEMEREELISSKRGTGYFFTEEKEVTKEMRRSLVMESLARFTNEMRALGCADREIIKQLETYMKEGGKNGYNAGS